MKKTENSQAKLKIRRGDLVQVIAGDSKGKQGKVVSVDREKNRVVVEGANMVSRHTKPSAASPNGGIVKKEAAIHASNVMLVDSSGKPTRVGKQLNADGKLVRIAKKSGEEIK